MNIYHRVVLSMNEHEKLFIIKDSPSMFQAGQKARTSPGWEGSRVVEVSTEILTAPQPALDS